MSYVIGYVVYGIPINKKQKKLIDAWESDSDCELWTDDNDHENGHEAHSGFTFPYSGNGEGGMNGFCGIIVDSFDETKPVNLDKLSKATPEQIANAERRIESLHSELKNAITTTPGHFIIWGTS